MQVEPPKEKGLHKLDTISEDIRAGCLEAAQHVRNAVTEARSAVVVAYEVGQSLLKAKSWLKHGEFERWCEQTIDGIAGVTMRTLQKYMALASKTNHASDLEQYSTLQRAYIDLGIVNPPMKEPKALGTAEVDIFASFVGKINKQVDSFVHMVSDVEIESFPQDRKDEVKAAIAKLKAIEERL